MVNNMFQKGGLYFVRQAVNYYNNGQLLCFPGYTGIAGRVDEP